MEMNLPPDLQEDMSGYNPLIANQDWRMCHQIVIMLRENVSI